MTLLERIARAICWKNGMNPDLTLGGDGQNFLWMEYEGQAFAAVEAMMDVSYETVNAGMATLQGVDHGYRDAFVAVLRAILNEAPNAQKAAPAPVKDAEAE